LQSEATRRHFATEGDVVVPERGSPSGIIREEHPLTIEQVNQLGAESGLLRGKHPLCGGDAPRVGPVKGLAGPFLPEFPVQPGFMIAIDRAFPGEGDILGPVGINERMVVQAGQAVPPDELGG